MTTKVEFKITEYGETGLMLVREQWYDPPIEGIPPSHSQVIMLYADEINLLMNTLGIYADKR